MTDERILLAGHAPTPFTAEQIREHCVDGLRVTIAVEDDSGRTFHTNTFRDGDAEGVTIEACASDRDGTPTGEVSSGRGTWLELQGHASFPELTTEVGEETIDGPLGIQRCRRYAVRGETGTVTFWFAVDHPGMPVRIERPGSVSEVVGLSTPDAGGP